MLYETVGKTFNLDKNGWRLCKDKKYVDELSEANQKSLKGMQLGHGDIIYLKKTDKTLTIGASSSGSNTPSASMEALPGSSKQSMVDAGEMVVVEKEEVHNNKPEVMLHHNFGTRAGWDNNTLYYQLFIYLSITSITINLVKFSSNLMQVSPLRYI